MGELAERFEELRIWQKARELVRQIYGCMEETRDYGFRDQIQRASVSTMTNIAEGFERGTTADFARFLDISKGSSGEVRSLLYVAEDLGYLPESRGRQLQNEYECLSKSIAALARSLRS